MTADGYYLHDSCVVLQLCKTSCCTYSWGVFYLFWMKDSETSIALFKKFDITCVSFGGRDEVLKDFNMPVFLTKRKIFEGRTVAQTSIEPSQYFLDCRDNGDKHLKEAENYKCKLS